MTNGHEPGADPRVLMSWIKERTAEFSPVQIVEADASYDADPDGNPIIMVTLSLAPPPGDGPWSASALRRIYDAVDGWARRSGYAYGAHVHLQTARLAQTG